MTKLNVHECWVYDYGCRADMVSKSDVDKVIVEKDKELHHHKYKRCLDLIEIAKLQRSKLMPSHAWWEVERARIKDERIKKLLALAEKFKGTDK